MTSGKVTQILQAIEQHDSGASEALLPAVYDELRELANARLARERPGQTLQATALVHEAYLRLVGPEDRERASWDGRGHFFAAAAQAMRRILVDRARVKGAVKRGGDGNWQRVIADLGQLSIDAVPAEFLDLDEALSAFHREDPEKARLVELRFFGGLSMAQAAAMLNISTATATRHWAYARVWLYDALTVQNEVSTNE